MIAGDIICALSTAPGTGAIALLRLSGEGVIDLVDHVFVAASGKTLASAKAGTVHFGEIMADDQLIDQVLITVFRSPCSYTGEDLIEIACHGSLYIQQRLLQIMIEKGARLAEPGEFTKRAFLNGKMDLSQAEAVADLIASSSDAAHRVALQQMKGGFSEELRKLRSDLLHITSLLELELDFSEEDVEFADRKELRRIAGNILDLVGHLCRSFALGNVIKNGVPVAIVGNTNVGKSTLLNVLLREEKAIVSDIAGTTRDVIEDTMNLNGITFRFIDTAGIRTTEDKVENMGIERTFAKIAEASIVLLLTDLSRGINGFDSYYRQVKEKISPSASLLIVLNKTDQTADLLTALEAIKLQIAGETVIPISAKTGYNIEQLTRELMNAVNLHDLNSGNVIVTNVRHYEALTQARIAIQRVISGLQAGLSGEFISQDIRECLHYLGEITGEITTDEVLGNIFQHFCIGK